MIVAAAIAAPAAAQQVAVRDLPRPSREIEDPFTLVGGAVEVRGKLLVADAAETDLALVDFATGARTAVGRKGAGPGEYSSLQGIFALKGDTVWVLDRGRMVVFLPDGKAGTTFPFVLQQIDPRDSTTLSAPMGVDARGMFYANALMLKVGTAGNPNAAGGARADVQFGDSSSIVRLNPRVLDAPRTKLSRVLSPTPSSGMQQQISGTHIKMTMAWPGLVPSDAWAVFADGRIGIVRGSSYTVEFIGADGRRGAQTTIPYERFKVAESDKTAEMDEVRRQMKSQMAMIKTMIPAGWTLDFDLKAPTRWPAEYPATTPIGVRAAPDGRLWVQRAVPTRIGREQWDVIDATGKLVARWRLPAKTTVAALGNGVAYTVRTDEDDLQYIQRVEIPR
jgi:hypothetical protein